MHECDRQTDGQKNGRTDSGRRQRWRLRIALRLNGTESGATMILDDAEGDRGGKLVGMDCTVCVNM